MHQVLFGTKGNVFSIIQRCPLTLTLKRWMKSNTNQSWSYRVQYPQICFNIIDFLGNPMNSVSYTWHVILWRAPLRVLASPSQGWALCYAEGLHGHLGTQEKSYNFKCTSLPNINPIMVFKSAGLVFPALHVLFPALYLIPSVFQKSRSWSSDSNCWSQWVSLSHIQSLWTTQGGSA